MSAIARRYARAAIEAARDAKTPGASQALAADLKAFVEAFQTSGELRELLVNPAFKQERAKVLTALLDRMLQSAEAKRLVVLLAEADRVGLIDEVSSDVTALADEEAGRARAVVTSAIALDEAQILRVGKALAKRVGREVDVEVEIDPAILGGLVCRVGDLTVDSSLRRQLALMREKLEAKAH